jgi:hypothetical protein
MLNLLELFPSVIQRSKNSNLIDLMNKLFTITNIIIDDESEDFMITKAIQTFNAKNYNEATVIGEFSGRDSVAAILKALENDAVNYVLPVATFAGTEYGDYDEIYENYLKLNQRVKDLYGYGKVIYPLLEYNREDLWHLMNGRVMATIYEQYQFVSPCIACHLYFHLTKLTLAKALANKIITGERESHDGKIKVNQHPYALDAYQEIIQHFDVELISPLRHIKNGDVVEKIIGYQWEEGQNHPQCVLSGNYRDSEGQAIFKETLFKEYLENFLKPVGILIGDYLINDTLTKAQLKNEVLKLI